MLSREIAKASKPDSSQVQNFGLGLASSIDFGLV